MPICTMKTKILFEINFPCLYTPWKVMKLSHLLCLKAYEIIIEYVASFDDFLETHAQHNKYLFSRISSSALLCGHVSLVRRRSCVTPALPTPQRWSDESRAEIKRRERNSTIKLKRNQILFLDLFQIFLFDKFQKSVAQHLYFTTSVIDSY